MAYQRPFVQMHDPPPVRTDRPNPPSGPRPRRDPDPVPIAGFPGQPGWVDAGPPTAGTRDNMARQGGLPQNVKDEPPRGLLPGPGMRDCPVEDCTWAGLPRDFTRHYEKAHSPLQEERRVKANVARREKRKRRQAAHVGGTPLEPDHQD